MTMAMILATFPAGYSAETKKKLLGGVKEIFRDAMGYRLEDTSVYFYEHKREDVCINAWEKMSLTVYYQKGHTEKERHRVALRFDELCARLFGEEKQDTYIIFKEHHTDNFGENGILSIYHPEYSVKYGL